MFEFEGDVFNASAVTAVARYQNEVRIYVYADPDPFTYKRDSSEEAILLQDAAVKAWKAAFSPAQ